MDARENHCQKQPLYLKSPKNNSTSHVSLLRNYTNSLPQHCFTLIGMKLQKTKTTKKQNVGCYIGDLDMKQKHQNKNHHQPVLLEKTLEVLDPQSGETYLDLTAGYAGHATPIIEAIGDESLATLVDRDLNATNYLRDTLPRSRVLRTDYLSAANSLLEENVKVDTVLLDVGVSSPQFDNAERGFSFREEAALDMRMDQSQPLSANDIVNRYSERELADLIYVYGEERASRRIAKGIVASRPIGTTTELAEVVARAAGKKGYWKIHPATKTFQALRIAVNDELHQLEAVLPLCLELLDDGGRMAVISFHSLEDRIVKRFMRERSSGDRPELQLLSKKPFSGEHYDVSNPRARSAKLRAAIKIKTVEDHHDGG